MFGDELCPRITCWASKSKSLNLVASRPRRSLLIGSVSRVVSVSDSQSSGPGFEFRSDYHLDLFIGSPEFKSSATLVNSQLVCLRPDS